MTARYVQYIIIIYVIRYQVAYYDLNENKTIIKINQKHFTIDLYLNDCTLRIKTKY